MVSLANSYLNQGRTLYMDNWYTSIPLAQELLDRNTACIRTIRKNRRGLSGVVVRLINILDGRL